MKWFQAIVSTIMVVAVCALISLLIYLWVIEASMYEVEIYSVGCEVSQMAYAEEQVSRTSTRPVYKMGVRCDDFATVFEITAEQFAQYVVGEIVEVEVTIEASSLTDFQKQEYKLLGSVIEN